MNDEVFSKVDIQNYSKKNTSPRMPIEEQYVNATLDSLLNSKSVSEKYKILKDETQAGNAFWFFNSFWNKAAIVNREPYRSIIAYSMLKKDIILFELISASLFTGRIEEYHGSDLYNKVVKDTDESPLAYTDSNTYTDMQDGIIQIAFHNWFCDDPTEEGIGSEYQTLEELELAIKDFDAIITMTKPARCIIYLFYQRYCFLGGDKLNLISCGVDTSKEYFLSPFGPVSPTEPNTSIDIIMAMTDNELASAYRICEMTNNNGQPMILSFDRTIIPSPGYLTFRYIFRTKLSEDHENDSQVWGKIKIQSNNSSTIYIIEKAFDEDVQHIQKYIPICLRLSNDPDAPILAGQIENGTPTMGAMFYTREKK